MRLMALTHRQYGLMEGVGIWHNDRLWCVDDNTTQVSDHTHLVRMGRDMPFSKGSYFQSLSGIWGWEWFITRDSTILS